MLCAPTGSGKTIIAAHLIKRCVQNNKRVNFVVDRTVLCQQTSQLLNAFNIPHGILAGHKTTNSNAPAQICMTQTMRARNINPANATLNIVDEAHITFGHIAQAMQKGGRWLGLSATPFRAGLDKLFDDVVNVASTHFLRDKGWLTKYKIYCGKPIKVSKKNSVGEYEAKATSNAIAEVTGDILEEWRQKTNEHFNGPVPTIVFGHTVSDCHMLADKFKAAGFDFRVVSYNTPWKLQQLIIRQLRENKILGIVSCAMLQRGFDVPNILCGIDAHPYRKSISSVVQQFGRILRPAPNKPYAIWLDHAQNFKRFRLPLIDFFENGVQTLSGIEEEAGEDDPGNACVCQKCGSFMADANAPCPECGWQKPKREISEQEATIYTKGTLEEMDMEFQRHDLPSKRLVWSMLCHIAKYKGKCVQSGLRYARANFKSLYKTWPATNWKYDPTKTYTPPNKFVKAEMDKNLRDWQERQRQKARDLPDITLLYN